jgi:hypothetical protein
VPGFLFRNFPEEFFNEPLDGIVYAVVLAMGYASVENMLYVAAYGINTTILRAFTAVPAHLVFAIVQGYYLGRARFMPEQKLESDNQRTGYFHCPARLLRLPRPATVIGRFVHAGAVSVYICLYYCEPLIREHLENSPFFAPDYCRFFPVSSSSRVTPDMPGSGLVLVNCSRVILYVPFSLK